MALGNDYRSIEELKDFLKVATRLQALDEARDNLLVFTQVTMPDPEDPDDVSRSLFEVKPHHRLIAQSLDKVARGESLREAFSMPPQHGKSELISRRFVAQTMGRFPHKNIIFATYNDTFAMEFGAEVRAIATTPIFAQIFPEFHLRKGSKAKDFMTTHAGGHISFIGRGGSGTGKAADIIIIDDPLKNAEEAESPTIRRRLHEWFSKVMYSRAKKTTAILIVQTRWNEDDLIGRLCDMTHPDRKRNENGVLDPFDTARQWHYVNIPAVVKDPVLADILDTKLEVSKSAVVRQAFGYQPMAALWPERFDLEHLASAYLISPATFNALYMGTPVPDDGEYFRAADIVEYEIDELPKRLRKYGASDHALSHETHADDSVLGCVGVDEFDNRWVLPDLTMEKMDTDRLVDEMISKMELHKPLLWYAEDDTIRKSIGPFLRKRMLERRVYTPIQTMSLLKDKMARARAAQGLTQLRKIRFPKFAPWYRKARAQMLKFPFGAKDDFVDWLAHISMGMAQQMRAANDQPGDIMPRSGTLAWMKANSKSAEQKVLANNTWR